MRSQVVADEHQTRLHHDEARRLLGVGVRSSEEPMVPHLAGPPRVAHQVRYIEDVGLHLLTVAPPSPSILHPQNQSVHQDI